MADVIAIREGADLDLNCPIVLQNEDMIISWTCENQLANVRSSRIQVTETGKLRIRSARLGDSCNYQCEAADGFASLSVIIKVIIVDKQMMDQIGHQNQTAPAGAVGPLKPVTVNQSQQPVGQPNNKPPTFVDERKLAPPDQGASLYGAHSDISSDRKLKVDEQGRPADLEVRIAPELVHVDRNRAFRLECRVKHAPHLVAPQIVWLKEFIGHQPESLREAHELNLVLIDNVYYHSLNWPRSNTYSQNSATAHSVLLVRHSNFVHSGGYICFAGYPPAIMSFNLSLAGGSATDDQDPTATTTMITSQVASGKSETLVRNVPSARGLLKYKMAVARVQVNDEEGETKHRHMVGASSANTSGPWKLPERNSLAQAILTNSWKRNLAASLLVLCVILCVSKFVYTRYCLKKTLTKSRGRQTNNDPEAANKPIAESTRTTGSVAVSDNLARANGPQLAVKQLQLSPNYNIPQSYNSQLPDTNCRESVGNDSISYLRHRQPESESCLRVLVEMATPMGLDRQETDHLYSEIGERFNPKPSQLPATNNIGGDAQIYKSPNNYNQADQTA